MNDKSRKADEFAAKVAPIINELLNQDMSLHQIAKELNERKILTVRGKAGGWTPTAVLNSLPKIIRFLDSPTEAIEKIQQSIQQYRVTLTEELGKKDNWASGKGGRTKI